MMMTMMRMMRMMMVRECGTGSDDGLGKEGEKERRRYRERGKKQSCSGEESKWRFPRMCKKFVKSVFSLLLFF